MHVVASDVCLLGETTGECKRPTQRVGVWTTCGRHTGWVGSKAESPVRVETDALPERKTITGLSPSATKLLLDCPRRFEFSKVLGLPEPSGMPAVAGTFTHKVLEVLSELPPPERTMEPARRIANELWATVTKPEGERPPPALVAPASDVDELRKDLASLGLDREGVTQLLGRAKRSIEVGVEFEAHYGGVVAYRELDVKGTTVGGVPFRGRVDRVDRHGGRSLSITDYKSGQSPTKDGRIDPEKLAGYEDQLLWYGPAVEQVTGEQVSAAILAFVGDDPLVAPVDLRKTGAAVAKLGRAWQDLQDHEAAATRVEFPRPYPANPGEGWLCGWCPFFERCPEGSAVLFNKRWAWMEDRGLQTGPKPAGWTKGWGPVPAKVEIDSWDFDRRQAWMERVQQAQPVGLTREESATRGCRSLTHAVT